MSSSRVVHVLASIHNSGSGGCANSIAALPKTVSHNLFLDIYSCFQANRSVTFKGSQTIQIHKCSSLLGIAIEGGTNTQQKLPRIISIQPTGAAYQNQELRVGQLISEVDGFKLTGKDWL